MKHLPVTIARATLLFAYCASIAYVNVLHPPAHQSTDTEPTDWPQWVDYPDWIG